jgi:hypothetical protein
MGFAVCKAIGVVIEGLIDGAFTGVVGDFTGADVGSTGADTGLTGADGAFTGATVAAWAIATG